MSRSLWKLAYFDKKFYSNLFNNKKLYFIWNRNSSIPSIFVNNKLKIHNGIWMLSVIVRSGMVGMKLGEFSITKRLGKVIHLDKKKNK